MTKDVDTGRHEANDTVIHPHQTFIKIQNFSAFDITAPDKKGIIYSTTCLTYLVPTMCHTALGPGDTIRMKQTKLPTHSHVTYILTEEKEEENLLTERKRGREKEKWLKV